MKRLTAIILLFAIMLCGCSPEIRLDASTTVTRTGTVTDRAMAFPTGSHKIWDKSYPYVGIEFEDGTCICIWNKNEIDHNTQIGDTVEVTYGLQEGTDHWILINIKEVN